MRGFMPYHNENSWTGLELVLVFNRRLAFYGAVACSRRKQMSRGSGCHAPDRRTLLHIQGYDNILSRSYREFV